MRCSKCGNDNIDGNLYCSSCGEALTASETPIEKPEVVQPVQKPKKKKGKGCLIALIVLLLIAGLIVGGIFLFKKLTYFEDPFPDTDYLNNYQKSNNYTSVTSFTAKIEEDYKNGVINTDKYMLQLAYSIYNPDLLDPAYTTLINDYKNPRDLFSKFGNNLDQLSDDTKAYIFGKYSLDFVQWDVENTETDNKSSDLNSSKYENVINTDAWVETLDSVILSKKGHFLLYYDAKGNYPVDKKKVEDLADFLEDAIVEYEKKYGLKYEYKSELQNWLKTPHAKIAQDHAKSLLKKNDIDTKYINTAMPVYLINMGYSIDIPAYYNGATGLGSLGQVIFQSEELFPGWIGVGDEELKTPAGEIQTGTASSTYTFPYFVINSQISSMVDTKLISAHELFHHYQHYICGDGIYKDCASGGFTVETTANLVAIDSFYTNKKGTAISEHSADYSRVFTQDSIDTIREGYPAYVFAYNYKELVPNGTKKLFNSLKHENALQYLYEESSGKYKNVLTLTAEKALTMDYKNKELLPYYEGQSDPIFPKNRAQLLNYANRSDVINYSAIQYYYIDPTIYRDNIQLKVTKTSNDNGNLILLLFNTKGNKYNMVFTHNLDKDFIINMKDFEKVGDLAIAIINVSPNTNLNYYISTNIGSDTPTTSPNMLKMSIGKTSRNRRKTASTSSIVCYQTEESEMYKTTYQVKVSFDNKDEVNDMYVKGTIEMDEDNPAFKIAKTVTSGLVLVLKQKYKEQFGKISLRTYDEGSKYVILGRVKKDYYTAIKGSFNTDSTSKEDIFNAIQNEGFICTYE